VSIWPPITEESVSLVFFISRILVAVALIFTPMLIRRLADNNHHNIVAIIKSIGMLVLGLCVSVPVVFFKFPSKVPTWIMSTFLNTSHGSDDASINIQSWIQYIINDYTPIPPYWVILVLLTNIFCVAFVTFLLGADARGVGGIRNRLTYLTDNYHSFVLLACSMLSICPIILSVNRLWGHYLHLGTILLVVAMLAFYEEIASYRFKRHGLSRLIRLLLALVTIIQILLIFSYMIPSMALEMDRYANRTTTSEYKKKKEEYEYILSLLSQRSSGKHVPIKAHIGADVFMPESNEKLQIIEIFGFFTQWEASPDLIIFYRLNSALSNKPSITSAQHAAWISANKAFGEHLNTDGNVCQLKPCYNEVLAPYPELVVLSKID